MASSMRQPSQRSNPRGAGLQNRQPGSPAVLGPRRKVEMTSELKAQKLQVAASLIVSPS